MPYTMVHNGKTIMHSRSEILRSLLYWRAFDLKEDKGVRDEVARLELLLELKDKQRMTDAR